MAHDGFARALAPSHTPGDGDVIFALATGERTGDADAGQIGALAAEVDGGRHRARRTPGDRRARLSRRSRSEVNLHLRRSRQLLAGADGARSVDRASRARAPATFSSRAGASAPAFCFRRCSRRTSAPDRQSARRRWGTRNGISAWWWVGSAAIGSIVLAFWIGPAMRRAAAQHQLHTVGDYLEHRYSAAVRGVGLGASCGSDRCSFSPASSWAMGSIIGAVAGTAPWVGCAIGGAVITVYFVGRRPADRCLGQRRAARRSKLAGFAMAVPLALAAAGGWQALSLVQPRPDYWQFWRMDSPGILTLAVIVPPFIVSPGLLAENLRRARRPRRPRRRGTERARSVSAFAIVPAILGIIARAQFPSLGTADAALPMILVHALPPLVGAIGLAAVFSAEVSAADAVLFMLTTSLSQDLVQAVRQPGGDGRGRAAAGAVHGGDERRSGDDPGHCARQRRQRADDFLYAHRRLVLCSDRRGTVCSADLVHWSAGDDDRRSGRRPRAPHRDRRARLGPRHPCHRGPGCSDRRLGDNLGGSQARAEAKGLRAGAFMRRCRPSACRADRLVLGINQA